jgi:hypothetical protein
MAGRVIPMFTNNGVRGAQATRHPAVERAALGFGAAAARARCGRLTGWPTLVVAVAAVLRACRPLGVVAAVEDAARPAGLGAAARVPVGAGAPVAARRRRAGLVTPSLRSMR